MIYLRTLVAAVVAITLIGTHVFVYKVASARADQRIAVEQAKAQATLAAATKNALEAQSALQAKIDNLTRIKNAQDKTITRQRDALVNSLRDRPVARDTTPAEDSPTGTGSTGAGLARGDAEFLAGYAADAAKLAAALNTCQAAYESARQMFGEQAP
jgi:hypothetical protein